MFENSCVTSIISAGVVVVIAYKWYKITSNPVRYRYGSFAPVRKRCKAAWYVDGKDYMSAVADAIEAAKTEIMITDWQMNPEIFMKRPDTGVNSLYWRLDTMLKRKAGEGVKVKVLLYKEMKLFLDLGSDHVVEMFQEDENIEIHRHPGFLTGSLSLFRWSHHEKMVIVDRSVAFVGGIDLCYGRWDTRHHELMDDFPIHPAVKGSKASDRNPHKCARWIGKDYRNTFHNKEKRTDWDKPLEGYEGVERNEIPRMPWHDVSCAFIGTAVQDAVQHFLERYNAITKSSWWRHPIPSLVNQPTASNQTEAEKIVLNSGVYTVNIQLLRSVDNWSAYQKHEESIHTAYIEAIKNAKHFIYIENQFFISSQGGEIQNKIQAELVKRIVQAHKAKEDFHVMVIIPAKPEFPGDWDAKDRDGDVLRGVTYLNQSTIFHGEDSLFSKLEKEEIPEETAMKYFSVYSLRQHGLIGTHLVTESVYVDSKVMIVDDRVAIIGSANINDRSMLGSRDSEVAVMIEDLGFADDEMRGVGFARSLRIEDLGFADDEMRGVGFARSLRCDLLKEHLGLEGCEVGIKNINPLTSSFISDRAQNNTRMFNEAFSPEGLPPSENVKDFEGLRGIPCRCKHTPQARKILKQIKGTLVNPLRMCKSLTKELKPSLVLDVSDLIKTGAD